MHLYTSLFDESEITSIEYGEAGTVKHATFSINGQEFMCIDSSGHEWTFTPAVSLFVTCSSEEEIARTFERLSQGGAVLMPLSDYGFSKSLLGLTINTEYHGS